MFIFLKIFTYQILYFSYECGLYKSNNLDIISIDILNNKVKYINIYILISTEI